MPASDAALIGVDWGTSSFRAFLMTEGGDLLNRTRSADGVLGLSKDAFPQFLTDRLRDWLSGYPGIPILMSGMVGSTVGWVDVPYLTCPVSSKDLTTALHYVGALEGHNVWIVPGIKTMAASGSPDVMRGEETQIAGALSLLGGAGGQGLFCLPGTHSKWVLVDGTGIASFATYLTGELFAVLGTHSILRFDDGMTVDESAPAFLNGIQFAKTPGGLPHHLFSARARVLTGEIGSDDVPSYLSGLLIAHELMAAAGIFGLDKDVTLIGDPSLTRTYQSACNHLGIAATAVNGEQCAQRGLHEFSRHLSLRSKGTADA